MRNEQKGRRYSVRKKNRKASRRTKPKRYGVWFTFNYNRVNKNIVSVRRRSDEDMTEFIERFRREIIRNRKNKRLPGDLRYMAPSEKKHKEDQERGNRHGG